MSMAQMAAERMYMERCTEQTRDGVLKPKRRVSAAKRFTARQALIQAQRAAELA
jgi:hypothetical protein